MRILILSGDTDGNLGDRAIVLATCRELKRINPEVRITLISGNGAGDRGFFGAEAIRRGLAGLPVLAKAAVESDLVLCGGGGLFQDDDSLIKMPYWAVRVLFSRLLCARVIGYCLGVGPLDRASSRLSARAAFLCMERVSVRDPEARKVAQPLTSRPVRIVPDPALLTPCVRPELVREYLRANGVPLDGTPIIGVAVKRWFKHSPRWIPKKYACTRSLHTLAGRMEFDRMTTLVAEVLDRVTAQHDARVLFMPTYNVAHEADDRASREVMAKMRRGGKAGLLRMCDPMLYKAVTGHLTVMLAGRMHPAIFSASLGTPVVGLAYNQKFTGFFELLGIRDHVMRMEDFVQREMINELESLLSKAFSRRHETLSRVRKLTETIREFNESIMMQ